MSIKGIPDGWDLVEIGVPKTGDWMVDPQGEPYQAISDYCTFWPIIRKIEKPKRYRPFANAAEFEPHRDKWIRRSHTGSDIAGCFRVLAYNDTEIWDSWSKQTYHQMFHDGRQFEDGTPFGVEVIDD